MISYLRSFFNQNDSGKWAYDNFKTIVNESLFANTKLNISSKIYDEKEASFLLSINGELNLNVLDVKKRKALKTVDFNEEANFSSSDVTTSKSTVDNQIDQQKDHQYDEKTGGIKVSAMNANQTNNGESKKTRKFDDKVLSVKEWDEEVTKEVIMRYQEITKLSKTIDTIGETLKVEKELTPVEQKSLLDQLDGLWNDSFLTPIKKYGKKLPHIGPAIKAIDTILKGVKFIVV